MPSIDPDYSQGGFVGFPALGPINFGYLLSDPKSANLGDMYFTGIYFRAYGTGGWSDLGTYLQSLPAAIIQPSNFIQSGAATVYGSATRSLTSSATSTAAVGTSTQLSRADHSHENSGLAKVGAASTPSSNGNTWYGYQTQSLDINGTGGWSTSDYLSVFMASVNAGVTINQQIYNLARQDALQYIDANSNTIFRVTASGQLSIGTTSTPISNAALSIRSFSSNFPITINRGAVSQTADLEQWQNSGGTVLAAIQAAGTASFSGNVIYNQATNAQATASYTLIMTDSGKIVEMNNATSNYLIIPSNANVPFATGTRISIIQTGAGATVFSASTGVTLNFYSPTAATTASIAGQWGNITLIKRAADTWAAAGDIK